MGRGCHWNRFAARVLISAFACTVPTAAGIIRWDGEGADQLFVTALNWSGDMVPMPTDEGEAFQNVVAFLEGLKVI